MIKISEKAFAGFGWTAGDEPATRGLRPCGVYMYVTGTNDSGTDAAEEDSSLDTTSESEAFH